jgi:hypothetical protein
MDQDLLPVRRAGLERPGPLPVSESAPGVARIAGAAHLDRVVVHAAGDLPALAEACRDLADVAAVAVMHQRLELAASDGQRLLGPLSEIATLSEVSISAVVVLRSYLCSVPRPVPALAI